MMSLPTPSDFPAAPLGLVFLLHNGINKKYKRYREGESEEQNKMGNANYVGQKGGITGMAGCVNGERESGVRKEYKG